MMMGMEDLLCALTLEEKAALLSGTNFMETNPIPRLGIPGLAMADGPHGLRKQIGGSDNGVSRSEPATAFPTAATVACSWNSELARNMGEAIAVECQDYGVNLLLGPGVNIKRNPLCGRNFEYYSEDPLLSGVLGAAFVQGVQSRNVGAVVKHFAANNAETYRFMGESVVDERALQEIYLPAFRRVIREAGPYAVMCAYNRLWGEFCSENRRLLTELLREAWNFDGVVMTDWGATCDRVRGVVAGLDLEMPGDTPHCRAAILNAAKSGALSPERLNAAVLNVLKLIQRCGKLTDEAPPVNGIPGHDTARHHALAAEIAQQSAVLLKNDGTLPLQKERKLLFVGDLFDKMRYQGSGSSMIHPARLTTPRDAMDARGISYRYAQGYRESDQELDQALMGMLAREIERSDTLVFFGGLTDYVESEGGDRTDMRLPASQLAVVEELKKSGKPVVLVLFGGSPVELPFTDDVNAMLTMYLPGQNGGEATAALLLGEVNPSGKLAESWPLRYEDVPFGGEFSKGEIELYRESVFVGYRYYGTACMPVRFPFGHGLSYTRYVYSHPVVREEAGRIIVTCNVRNDGDLDGAEVLQLYVRNVNGPVARPVRELRAFDRLYLRAGEIRQATLTFGRRELAWFHPVLQTWVLDNGSYGIQIGASSEDIRLEATLEISGELPVDAPYGLEVTAAYRNLSPSSISDKVFEALLARAIPKAPPQRPMRMESMLRDFTATPVGHLLYASILSMATRQHRRALRLPNGSDRDNQLKGALFLHRVLSTNSLRSLSMSAGGRIPYHTAQGFVALANGSLFTALRYLLRPVIVPPLPKDAIRKTKRERLSRFMAGRIVKNR